MAGIVLIVEANDAARYQVREELTARDVPIHEVKDAVGAMGVLGRSDFSAILMTPGARRLSLKGLCQIARRKHPDVILLLRGDPSERDELRSTLHPDLEIIDGALGPSDTVDTVCDQLAALEGFEESTATQRLDEFDLDVDLGGDGWGGDDFDVDLGEGAAPSPAATSLPTAPDAPTAPKPSSPFDDVDTDVIGPPGAVPAVPPVAPVVAMPQAEPEPLLHGDLREGGSAALLMALYAQSLTGRLEIDEGEARGTLLFFEGSPVAAEDPDGDAGLRARLLDSKLVPTDLTLKPPEGELMAALADSNVMSGDAVNDFLRTLVRERVLGLCMQANSEYTFFEDDRFVHTVPFLKVNPFGLAVEARRRKMPAPDVLRMAGDLKDQMLVPQPMLREAAHKLEAFVRGKNLADLIPSATKADKFYADTGLDDLMGTLLLLTLDDARLIEIMPPDEPLPSLPPLRRVVRSPSVDASIPEAAAIEDEEDDAVRAVASQVASLYMKLKPMNRPSQVLGVAVDASTVEVKAAYDAAMTALAEMKIPDGEEHSQLRARLKELREKLSGAYAVLSMGDL